MSEESPSRFGRFVGELHRRHVVRSALGYAVGAWVVIEVASVILPAFGAPNWMLQAVIVLCVVGFPVALMLSWVFDVGIGGVVRTDHLAERATPSVEAHDEALDLDSGEKATATPSQDDHPEDADDATLGGLAERRSISSLRYAVTCLRENGDAADPEELHEILPGTHRLCAEAIRRYGGHGAWTHQTEGEAYFGYPTPSEHHAQLATRCAVELSRMSDQVQGPEGIVVKVSAGVHTGLAVMVVGGPQHPDGQGEPIASEMSRFAGRLVDLAPPGRVVVSAEVRALVGEVFELHEHDDLKAGGTSRRTYLVGPQHSEVHRTVDRPWSGALHGREHELGLLVKRWEQATEGSGGSVALIGEAGIGKSALVAALTAHVLGREGNFVAELDCSPLKQNVALCPVVELISRSLIGLREGDTVEMSLHRIVQYLTERGVELEGNVQLLAGLTSVASTGAYAPLHLDAEQVKRRTIDLIIRLVFGRARRQPLLLVVEDLHWSDPSTVDLMEQIIGRGPEARLLVVMTYRPTFEPPWGSGGNVTQMTLAPLGASDAYALVDHAARGAALEPSVRDHIVAHSDGVPLFLEELTKAVLESSVKVAPESGVGIPATLQDTLTARLHRLGSAKRVALVASVIGREFGFGWLQALMELDDATLDRHLQRLVASELAYQRGTPPHATYLFKHALIQEAAYASLVKADRREMHRKVASLLEGRFRDYGTAHPQVVGQHYVESGDSERALPWLLEAAKDSLAHSAYEEGIRTLRTAIGLLADVPPSRKRDELEMELQINLGQALTTTHSYVSRDAERTFERAAELSSKVGEVAVAIRVAIGLWKGQIAQGRLPEALRQTEHLLKLADASGAPPARIAAHTAAGITRFHLGELQACESYFESVVEGYDVDRYRHLAHTIGQDPCAAALIWYAQSRWLRGYGEDARRKVDQSVSLGRRLEHPFTLAYSLHRGLTVFYLAKDRDAMVSTVAELETLADENNFAEMKLNAAVWRTLSNAKSTGSGGALDSLARLVGEYESSHLTLNLPFLRTLAAQQYLAAGKTAAGLEQIEAALRGAQDSRIMWQVSEMFRLKGDLLADRGDSEAEQAYQRAVAVALEQDARFYELHARVKLARLYLGSGRPGQARTTLSSIDHLGGDLGDVAVRAEADTLLEALGT